MKYFATASVLTALLASACIAEENTTPKEVPAVLDFEMTTLDGKKIQLADAYKDRVVLFVNVASQCGLTPQYEQLQELHEKYADKGLAIIGIPCNQFGKQEPGSADEIRDFCTKNYGVDFDMLGKVNVNGDEACDLYKFLTQVKTEGEEPGDIQWNFEKFLVSRNGNVVARFSPRTRPDDAKVVEKIEAELEK